MSDEVSDEEESVVITAPPHEAKQDEILPPMLFNSKLEHVELTEARGTDGTPKMDPKTGARMMRALKVAGVDLDKLKVDMLRRLCSHYGIKKYRNKKKEDMLILIAQVQQTHAAYNALDDDEATKGPHYKSPVQFGLL